MVQWRTIAGWGAMCAVLSGGSAAAQISIASATLSRERGSLVTAADPAAGADALQPAATLEAALRTALTGAGVIFTGEVIAIDRSGGTVSVRWRVDDGVRGVSAGALYEQKEWAGLWGDGNARYAVGERALVLLHAPSVAGYATPVEDGVIPLRGDGISGMLDLRWMAHQVAVADSARLRPFLALRAAGGDFAVSDALQKRSSGSSVAPRPSRMQGLPVRNADPIDPGVGVILSPPTDTAPDDANAHVDSAMILGMLHAWQRAGSAAR